MLHFLTAVMHLLSYSSCLFILLVNDVEMSVEIGGDAPV